MGQKNKVKKLKIERFREQNDGIINNGISINNNENNAMSDNNEYTSQRNNYH